MQKQGVVTYMSRVETFATGIKIESSNQSHNFLKADQGDLQTAKIKVSKTLGYNLTFGL